MFAQTLSKPLLGGMADTASLPEKGRNKVRRYFK